MIPGHYITGESYDIPLDFPKDSERNLKFKTKIFNIFNFWLKIWWKILNVAAQNWKCWKILVSNLKLHFFYIFIKKVCFQIEDVQWTLCATQMNIKMLYFRSSVVQAQLFNPHISQLWSFLKILVYLQTGCLGGSLQWTVQWMHLKAHNASKDVSG